MSCVSLPTETHHIGVIAMGKASRRKRERKTAETSPDHGREFRAAMAFESVAEQMQLVADGPSICIACSACPSDFVGVWFVSEEFGRELDVPEGKARLLFYRVCDDCAAAPDPAAVESAILARLMEPAP
jgi:hypothetical protein